MKNKKLFLSLLPVLIIISVFMINCDKKPTAPERDNPLDYNNIETAGDPFELTAVIDNGGVKLTWSKVEMAALQGYNIYRSEQETSGYSRIKQVSNSQTYTDKTIENGHSYWYKVTAYITGGEESSQTNMAAVKINANPFIQINGNDEGTVSRNVNLTILAATAVQMWICNNAQFSDGNWESYTTSKSWTLSTGEESKIVYLKVKYNDDTISEVSSDTIFLDKTAPTADFSATPDYGIAGETTFSFDASASSDNFDYMEYRWDYENDGAYNTDWETTEAATHQYSTGGGNKTISLEVKDSAGHTSSTSKQIYVNTRPTASFTITQDQNNATLFYIDASSSRDYEDGTNLEYRWDWENDGYWDTNYDTTTQVKHQYSSEGEKTVKIEVIDTKSLTNSTTNKITVPLTLTDIDGNIYKTVKIGEQYWTAQNLRVTRYRNGDPIPNITNSYEWAHLSTGAYCIHNNEINNIETYGHLYNFYAISDSRKIAPEGWHVPTDAEWKELEIALGMSQSQANEFNNIWRGTNEGSKLANNSTLWKDGSLVNDLEFGKSGFSALPAGFRDSFGANFNDIGARTLFCTASKYDDDYVWYREIQYKYISLQRNYTYLQIGFSIRLVRD